MIASGVAAFAVDAGGSRTTVRIRHPSGREETWERPSCAIAAVGPEQSSLELVRVLTEVWRALGPEGSVAGCLASSSFPVAGEAPAPDSLLRAIAASPCRGRVFVVNDVVPLLWAKPVDGHGVIVNSGTGSAVIGRRHDGTVLKLGGHEHILSDVGSAYSIARAALRAATLAVDGLGPGTQLVDRSVAFYGRSLPQLGRWLAELGRARSEIARFAADVVAAAESGDGVAEQIVSAESAGLGEMAVSAVQRLELGPEPAVGLSGGVLRASDEVRQKVLKSLFGAGLRPDVAVLKSVAAVLDFVGRAARGGHELLGPVGGVVVTLDP